MMMPFQQIQQPPQLPNQTSSIAQLPNTQQGLSKAERFYKFMKQQHPELVEKFEQQENQQPSNRNDDNDFFE